MSIINSEAQNLGPIAVKVGSFRNSVIVKMWVRPVCHLRCRFAGLRTKQALVRFWLDSSQAAACVGCPGQMCVDHPSPNGSSSLWFQSPSPLGTGAS